MKVQAQIDIRRFQPNLQRVRALTKDGCQRWLQAFTASTEFAGQDAIQATFLDVTERMEVEVNLRLASGERRTWREDVRLYEPRELERLLDPARLAEGGIVEGG